MSHPQLLFLYRIKANSTSLASTDVELNEKLFYKHLWSFRRGLSCSNQQSVEREKFMQFVKQNLNLILEGAERIGNVVRYTSNAVG